MSVNLKKDSPYGKQESLQAIVIADSFFDDLKPVEKIYPSILLPTVISSLFDYLLETLLRSRVQQVFLYCSSHVDKMKALIDSYKHYQENDIVLTPIISDGCRSLGDALRDMDTKGCIRGDFILIRGTAFANIDLKHLMDLHRTRKKKDKNSALTMVLRNLGSIKDSSLKNVSSFVVSNANTRKLLYYKKFSSGDRKVEFELQWFLEHEKVEVNTALFDTHIYLCSQSVLPLFADNFDFQTMEDFIRGVLINEEFLDARIYWEPLPYASYALSINSWKTYQILCRDILQRQSYPLVPDTLPSLRDFIYMSRSTYKHCNSSLSKGCTLHSESIVGEQSILAENSFINKSIIGPKCKIGKNVNISNSYIISDVIIEDYCVISNSIIFSNCIVTKGLKLNTCIILPNVKCIEDYNYMFIEICDGSVKSRKIEDCNNDCDPNFLGMFAVDYTELEECDDDASSSSSRLSAWSTPSSRDSPAPPLLADDEMFLSEVIDSLLRGYQEKLGSENLILEINSSRYAYNVGIRQVSYNVIKAVLKLPLLHCASKSNSDTNSKTQTNDYHKMLKTMLIFFKPVILNYIKTENAQEDCLRAIQDAAYTNQEFIIPCAQSLLHFFYDNDILLEETIITWYEQDFNDNQDINYCDNENDNLKQETKQNVAQSLRNAVSPFIKWLKEAEEDTSSDSS